MRNFRKRIGDLENQTGLHARPIPVLVLLRVGQKVADCPAYQSFSAANEEAVRAGRMPGLIFKALRNQVRGNADAKCA